MHPLVGFIHVIILYKFSQEEFNVFEKNDISIRLLKYVLMPIKIF